MPLRLYGATSGYVDLAVPDVADNGTVTLSPSLMSPGLVLITTQSFSAAASVNVNNCFSSQYDNYRLVFSGAGSADAITYMRLRASGTDATGTNYTYQILGVSATVLSGAQRYSSVTAAEIGAMNTDAGGIEVAVYRPAVAVTTVFRSLNAYTSSGAYIYESTGRHAVSTAYDGFTIYPGSGTITGTLSVYGYRKA